MLPSYKQQLAIVYDEYMETMGGGERSALAYALALQQLDFTVEILSTRPVPTPAAIVRTFGVEFASVAVRQVATRNVVTHVRAAAPTVFVNHTFMDFKPNPARIGIYSQMFPVSKVSGWRHRREVESLATYQLMLCNSSFTKTYSDSLWDFPVARSHVLHPPIGRRHTARIAMLRADFPAKKRQFINIGRFNPGTHNKNQKVVIETFLDARRRFESLRDWTLLLVGNSNKDADSQRYLADCSALAAASGGAVVMRQNLAEEELATALSESFGYVHATGAFYAPGEAPFKCEHFGLSIIEAMANGCLPLVYGRGGVFDVLEPGRMGIPYMTREGLVEGYATIAGTFGTPAAAAMQQANLAGAERLDIDRFTEKLAGFIAAELNK